jgi:glycerophosphoryl diester phosphodiesterase
MTAPAWLTQRPIAHRGLHAAERGLIENSLSAAQAAIAAGYAIECDVQLSEDGEAMVFHDFELGRLTAAPGRLDALPAAALGRLSLKGSGDQIPTLEALVSLIDGRAPLVCEIKSRFDGDRRLAQRAFDIAAAARGPIALKSFDPEVIAFLRQEVEARGVDHVPLGVVAMDDFHDAAARIDEETRRSLRAFLHWRRSRPDFLSFCVDDLPHPVPGLLRAICRTPVMVWTVRRRDQAAAARQWADQIIFEGDVATAS